MVHAEALLAASNGCQALRGGMLPSFDTGGAGPTRLASAQLLLLLIWLCASVVDGTFAGAQRPSQSPGCWLWCWPVRW